MNHFITKLLRLIGVRLVKMSQFPIGNPRTLNLYQLPFIIKSLTKVLILVGGSSFFLSIFGLGVHQLVDILYPEQVSSSRDILGAFIIFCSTWIFIVSVNHIHDVIHMMAQMDHYYELLWMIPCYISLVVVGPFVDFFLFILRIPFGYNLISFTDLYVCVEAKMFIMETIPTYASFAFDHIRDNFPWSVQDIRGLGTTAYNMVVAGFAYIVAFFFPDWFADTRVGRYIIISIGASMALSFFAALIWKLMFGWW